MYIIVLRQCPTCRAAQLELDDFLHPHTPRPNYSEVVVALCANCFNGNKAMITRSYSAWPFNASQAGGRK
jgi:hypothetical protein